jgi:hypothetical protein
MGKSPFFMLIHLRILAELSEAPQGLPPAQPAAPSRGTQDSVNWFPPDDDGRSWRPAMGTVTGGPMDGENSRTIVVIIIWVNYRRKFRSQTSDNMER